MNIQTAESKIKEIKSFVIKQMSDVNVPWEKNRDGEFVSRYITITTRYIRVRAWDDISVTRKEIGLSRLKFYFLLRRVKKAVALSEYNKERVHLAEKWDKFLEKNKDIMRDSKLDQILDK